MEAVEIVADASMGSVRSSDSAVGVASVESQSHNDAGPATVHAPLSPQRSTQASVASSPGSVRHPGQNVEATPHSHSQSPVTQTTEVEPAPQFGMPALEYNPNGVLLGVQQLERQQIALEQRRTHPSDPMEQDYLPTRQRSTGFSDDERTEPSSSATGNTGDNAAGYTRADFAATSTFGRMIQAKKRSNSDKKESGSDDEGETGVLEGAVIYGYLQKLGRNGKWQTRWFESDGECLTYYKSSKRSKLLATLDLAKVGSIVINQQDSKGCCFTINISERPYHLRADSKAACNDWVITLNRVKEARMQQGNVKLFTPDANQPPDLLDHDFTPRVVVVANRHRTRAVDDEEMHSWEASAWNENPASEGNTYMPPPTSTRLARWQKPHTSLSRIASKLLRWARSLRKSCVDAENHVILDHHVHPPGHDDKPKLSTSPEKGVPVDPVVEHPGRPRSINSGIISMDVNAIKHTTSPAIPLVEEEETRELS